MVDVHCHLNFKAFSDDYKEVIKQAKEAGVTTIINVGTQVSSSERAVELASQYKNLYAIVGVHPHHADKTLLTRHPERSEGSQDSSASPQNDHDTYWLSELEAMANNPKVVAIGEIGMDNYRYQSNGIVDPATQKEVFIAQIELASKLKLPLQIHNRHAGEAIVEILKEHKSLLQPIPGMFHCFAGTKEVLKDALDLGFYIGFDGNITYSGLAPGETVSLSELASLTPLERIVTETDSPYLTPEPHRGTRNMPAYVKMVVQRLSEIKNLSFEATAGQTSENAKTLFRLAIQG